MSILAINDLLKLLPQRFPFLMIDRVELSEDATTATAIKNVTTNESQFMGHFPNNPIMPGVLQLEAMVQTATIAFNRITGCTDTVVLRKVSKMRFKTPMLPGDQAIIEITITENDEQNATVKATAKVRGKVCSQSNFVIGKLKDEELVPKTFTSEYQTELYADTDELVYNTNDIAGYIPHRYPFHFIDNVRYKTDYMIIGEKLVSVNEPFSKGFNKDQVFMPNAMILETAAQLGCVFMLSKPENSDKIALFLSIEKADITRPAIPGDKLTFTSEVLFAKGPMGKCHSQVFCGEELIADMVVAFALVPKEA